MRADRESIHSRANTGGRVYPLAALLLAAASVLERMARNLGQTTPADVAPTVAATLAFALGVWLLAALARRRADAGAALIAAIWTIACLYYAEIFGNLDRSLGGGYPLLHAFPVALAAMGLLTWAAWRWGHLLRVVHLVLIGVGAAMLLPPVWKIAAHEWAQGDVARAHVPDAATAAPASGRDGDGHAPPAAGDSRPPDIYHFIFDRYGSERTLADRYGIDEPIGTFLESRGFYVAREARANYQKTGHSLASIFAMDYLTPLAEGDYGGRNWRPIFGMLDDHAVGRFLRERGYEHHQYGSWWAGTFHNSRAVVNRPHGFSEFNMIYLRGTILRPLFHLLPDTPLTMRLDWDNAQCQRLGPQLEEIRSIGERDRPVYVFAHILVPHGPYVFTPEGDCLDQRAARGRGPRQGYVDQIGYADTIMRDMVAALLSEDRAPPVIIFQADEGPFLESYGRGPWQEAPAADLAMKYGILTAIFVPGGDHGRFRQDMTAVNTYRLVFNTVFGTDFPELPDRIFAFPNDGNIYDFHDVTERLREDAPSG